MRRLMMTLLVTIFLVSTIFLGVCISQPKYGGTVITGVYADMNSLDPHKTGSHQDMRRVCLMCNNLVETTREGEYKPALATSWDVSADGKEWIFHLRKGVKFHNGREMTAEDIKWNFERMLSPKSNFRGQLGIIESIKAVDRYTVQLVLKKPWKTLLALIAGSNTQTFFIAPESENKDGSITHPIGTGPFEFVEWKTQDYIKFKRFKDYWEKGLPYLDEVIVKPVTDEMVRLTAIQTGDLHIAQRLSMTNVIELMKKPQKDFHFVPGVEGIAWITFDHTKPPFNDKRVRQAVAYGINKNEFLQGIFYGKGQVVNQMFVKGSLWYCDVPDVAQNKEKAKALLREAGYPAGLKVKLPTATTPGYFIKTAQIMQAQLKEVGIEIELEVNDLNTLMNRIFKKEFDIMVGGLAGFDDPDFPYRGFLTPQGQLSFFLAKGYNNPEVTGWLEQATQFTETNRRKEFYCKAVKTINEEYPIIFTTRGEVAWGIRNNVKGYIPHDGEMDRYANGGLHHTWLEK